MLLSKNSSKLLHQHATTTLPMTVSHSLNTSVLRSTPVHQHDETEECLTLALDVVPGFASDNINVSMKGNDFCLLIEGSCTNRVGYTFYVQKHFVLGKETYNLNTTQGNLSAGVLEITILKRQKPQPHIILITTNKKVD
jgi:HSP20 family molecular chaperone IbpA